MKTINYRHQVEVIETYDIEYTLEDFILDVQYYEIENLTYEELQDILENQKDVMITVNDYHHNDDGVYVKGPHFVDAYEFFTRLLTDYAFDNGPFDSDYQCVLNREYYFEEK
jgi:hypothetical protein